MSILKLSSIGFGTKFKKYRLRGRISARQLGSSTSNLVNEVLRTHKLYSGRFPGFPWPSTRLFGPLSISAFPFFFVHAFRFDMIGGRATQLIIIGLLGYVASQATIVPDVSLDTVPGWSPYCCLWEEN